MKNLLYSAIIGDICGSVYEFRPTRNYDKINLTDSRSFFTDDTVCTIAVADALMSGKTMVQPLSGKQLWHNVLPMVEKRRRSALQQLRERLGHALLGCRILRPFR